MNPASRLVVCLLVLSLAALSSGCVAVRIRSTVVFDESKTLRVRFTSAQAAALFHEALNKRDIPSDDPAYTTSGIELPLLALVHYEHVDGTRYYNAQVRRADANADGTISDVEAFRYVALRHEESR